MSENEIVNDFLVESYENLDRLDRELVGLEKNPGDRDALAGVFRTIHTIKGTCGFLGFTKLEKVAHAGENLLALLRDGKLVLNPEITTALLRMVDAIRQVLADIQTSGQDGAYDYPELLDHLKRLQTPDPSVPASAARAETELAPAPDEIIQHLPAPEKIGGVLVEHGIVSPQELAEALKKQEEGDERKVGDILVAEGHVKAEDVTLAQTVIEARSSVPAGTIRVGVNLLDNLMNLVGELVLARNQLLQFANTSEGINLQGVSQRMNLIATELQEEVMKTRMQPIGNIWNQFPRTVRDVALSCNKEVRIEMEGNETELDKTIIEAIKDPLTHLVRNSVDHGIEFPQDRVKVGKDRVGRLILRAFHEGGQVNIEIVDDGAGLNRDRIRQKAIERGVGMDVVKTNVEKIGGTVDIHSKFGEGTTIRIKIPLTLAIIPALVVTSSHERFAIPQVNLAELVRVEANSSNKRIKLVHGAPVYRLRGCLLPLVYLGKELQLGSVAAESSSQDRGINIVVLQAGERQFGLVVDEVNDTQEIVVKPLSKELKGIKTFAGASIMGDGKIALILDVMGVAQRSGVISEARDRALGGKSNEVVEKAREKKTFLLFAGPDDSCMALPTETLDRLEELPSSQVEQSGSQWVAQYRGRILPLIHLGSAFDERHRRRRAPKPAAESIGKQFQVLVCHNEGQTVGVVVERILDIVEDAAEVQYPATRAGIRCSAVINGRVTELIDIPAILRSSGLQQMEQPAEAVH
jgi:two-component system chemotaxis sensor kinase CheA